MQNKKPCVIYCRQSSVKQNNNSIINTQEEILKAIADKRELEIKKIFKDIGETTEIKKLIEWINQNKVDYLLVTGIDRLCRHQADFNQLLGLILRKNLKGIITPNKEFDIQKDISSILILGIFCSFEKEIISERIKAGLQNKRNK
ncbi:MAG: recombinase family protein [Candidatus Shapirobacteria bacterium]|nr:recombinase family protein [Candidatus Shapirobacteria bacterium]